jgi:hypothetical protein
VYAEDGGGVREVLIVSLQSLLNVDLLKFLDRFFQENMAVEHLFYQGFKLCAQFARIPFRLVTTRNNSNGGLRSNYKSVPVRSL